MSDLWRNRAIRLAVVGLAATLGAGRGLSAHPGPRAPETPETRPLTGAEAERVLERDWLFQATGEPLLSRASREIGWTRELIGRLERGPRAPFLAAKRRALDALRARLAALRAARPAGDATAGASDPVWIWYGEGRPAEDAPAATRLFRCRFELPARGAVLAARLRIAADDACEVFLNGARIGSHATWQHAAVLDLRSHVRAGSNLLAVRAENRPAPTLNPAGLIARLTAVCEGGGATVVVTGRDWRVSDRELPGWEGPELDDRDWPRAVAVAPWGEGPWGRIAGLREDDPTLGYAGSDPDARALYLDVRRVKRSVLMRSPALDFSRILCIDQPLPQGPESRHEAIHRMGTMAVPGGRLLVLDGLHPGGSVRSLAPEEPGSFWRPDLSFDASRVLYCFKPQDERSFHLYEIGIDGTGNRRLTSSDYDDIDPLYLPDGHILFTTTRGHSYVRCGPFIHSYVLARCDADGGDIYLISRNGEPDFVPALLPDGRVVYSRWEYTDKPLWRLQKLWTTNPDGTGTAHFWGNQSVWPDHLSEPRPIPGSPRVMFSGVGHHDWWSGSIGIVDPRPGRDYPHGLTKVTADLAWPEVTPPPDDPPEAADYHASGRFTGYKTPYPLSEEIFLVSARGLEERFRLYLMDVHGNRELLHEGAHNVWHAIPVRPRRAPAARPDRVAWPGTGKDRGPVASGVLYSPDVYEGTEGLPRGSVRYLRVLQQDHKTYSTWNKTYRHSGPPVSIVQEESVKRVLSEVEVASDGSVHFEVPAGRALYFQLLDADRRCLQTMRSFTGVMPGERRGCVGCHEQRASAPPSRRAQALLEPPARVSPPSWGDESISYERFAQPVLDRHCVGCHDGSDEAHAPDLTLRRGHDVFREPYLTLVGSAGWGTPVAAGGPGWGIAGTISVESRYGQNDPEALRTLPPMRYLSATSRLIDLAGSGEHHGVRVDRTSLHRLIVWVDACCPYLGEEEVRRIPDPDFPGIERLPIRPRVATAPVVERP